MSTQVNISKKITVKDEAVVLTSDVNSINFTGTGITATTVGNDVTVTVPGSGLTVGTTAIASGTDGRVLFQDAGVLQQDASFFWDNTNKRLGLGATPATNVRLDVRAQGALSTDLALRVRNSANTGNLFDIQGDGKYRLGDANGGLSNCFSHISDGRLFMAKAGGNFIELNPSGGNRFYNPAGGWVLSGNTNIFTVAVGGNTGNATWHFYAGNLQIGTGIIASGTASGAIWMTNGTAPAANTTNRHWYYSADITAGNAAPHFRTENGDVIKIYRETTAVAAAAFVANTSLIADDSATFGGYTMGQVVAALKAQGLLA